MKVAKLVTCTLITRVVVEDTATDDDIITAARPKLRDKIDDDLGDNIEEIYDDEAMPFGEGLDDQYFQPNLLEEGIFDRWMELGHKTYDVYRTLEDARKQFPFAEIIEYSGDDIEDFEIIKL